MSKSEMPDSILRLGRFELDLTREVLCGGGVRVPLPPQAAKLLCLLGREPGRLVTRAAIREALWPGGGIASDEALNTSVHQLRRLLERHGVTAVLGIETVPRRGYRLTATVPADQRGHDAATAELQVAMHVSKRSEGAQRMRLLLAAAVLALALSAAALQRLWPFPQPQITPLSVTTAPVFAGSDPQEKRAATLLAHAIAGQLAAAGSGALTHVPWKPGTAYDTRARALRHISTHVDVDLLLETSIHQSRNSLVASLHLFRVDDGALVWAASANGSSPEELVASAAADFATALKEATSAANTL